MLVGHSERRHDHGESDQLVAAKLAAARRDGLAPVLCVGETQEERRRGATFEVVGRQLASALADGAPGRAGRRLRAGLGDRHRRHGDARSRPRRPTRFCAREPPSCSAERRAAGLRLLYGGSVKPDNAEVLAAAPDIDGFLVGGASLDAAKFSAIIRGLLAGGRTT